MNQKQKAEEFLLKAKENSHYQIEDEEGVYHLEAFIVEAMVAFHQSLVNEVSDEKIERCKRCGCKDLIETDDHYTSCLKCGLSWVG